MYSRHIPMKTHMLYTNARGTSKHSRMDAHDGIREEWEQKLGPRIKGDNKLIKQEMGLVGW